MPLRLRPGACLAIALVGGIAAWGCEEGGEKAVAGAARTAAPGTTSAIQACSLLTPDEVSAIFGRPLEASGSGSVCEYGLDVAPAKSERPAVELGVFLDAATEPEVKSAYEIVAVGDEISSVGDWAFVVTVAATKPGFGLSSESRILETRRGPLHLKVGAVTALDPDTRSLDATLAAVARAAFWRLEGLGTKKSEK